MVNFTHICGTFLINAPGSFLNGAGLGEGEDRNVSVVKTFRDGQYRVPYVSSQSWKRWLRITLIEETGWNPSELRAIQLSDKGTTNKIGGEFNPVDFAEDDIFGYMRAEKGAGKIKATDDDDDTEDTDNSDSSNQKQKGRRVRSLTRTSPFSASILASLRKTGWQGRDEGFVHLKEGTPQPYTTEFYNTNLQGIFSLNYSRLGVFSNLGDRIELDEDLAKKCIESGQIKIKTDEGKLGIVYELSDSIETRKERAIKLMHALSVLRGGAKQAAFGTDVSPKVLILAGLNSGNPIFNTLFTDDQKGVRLDLKTLKEIVNDYKDKLSTPVLIGIRNGFLSNEQELKDLQEENEVKYIITTPIKAVEELGKFL